MAYKTALIPDTASAGPSHQAAERWTRNGFPVLQARQSTPAPPQPTLGRQKEGDERQTAPETAGAKESFPLRLGFSSFLQQSDQKH